MDAYDLDGTLADTRYVLAAARGLANVFKSAEVLYTPRTDFIVITARTHSTKEQRDATTQWLNDNQPNHKAIYYVDSGSEQQIAEEKVRVMKTHNVTSFTDNNPDVLKRVKELLPELDLFIIRGGKRERYS